MKAFRIGNSLVVTIDLCRMDVSTIGVVSVLHSLEPLLRLATNCHRRRNDTKSLEL